MAEADIWTNRLKTPKKEVEKRRTTGDQIREPFITGYRGVESGLGAAANAIDSFGNTLGGFWGDLWGASDAGGTAVLDAIAALSAPANAGTPRVGPPRSTGQQIRDYPGEVWDNISRAIGGGAGVAAGAVAPVAGSALTGLGGAMQFDQYDYPRSTGQQIRDYPGDVSSGIGAYLDSLGQRLAPSPQQAQDPFLRGGATRPVPDAGLGMTAAEADAEAFQQALARTPGGTGAPWGPGAQPLDPMTYMGSHLEMGDYQPTPTAYGSAVREQRGVNRGGGGTASPTVDPLMYTGDDFQAMIDAAVNAGGAAVSLPLLLL